MDEATDEQQQSVEPTGEAPDVEVSESGAGPEGLETTPKEALDAGTSPAQFEQLSQAVEGAQPAALSLLYDLDLPVAIELGRTRLSVQDVLGLARGSVVQLDRQAGEPVDVYVGDRRFAEGEVVIVGEQFGVRITRIVNTAAVAAVSGV
ncbi:MAG: flagellar motor switch protein FliN [Longimicrobiales bacterium]